MGLSRLVLITVHLLAGFSFMIEVSRRTATGRLQLAPGAAKLFAKSPVTFDQKLQLLAVFAAGHALVQLLAIMLVALSRLVTVAADPLGGHDHLIEGRKRIHQNTTEQSLFSLVAQLALLPHLTGAQLLLVLPLMNLFFVVGRVAFVLGYPTHRIAGFQMTFVPSILATLFATYKSGVLLGLICAQTQAAVNPLIDSAIASIRG